MARLSKLIARIGSNLRELTLSQRLVIVLSGLLVGVSLLWLVRWAAVPELAPLLPQDLQPEELALVRSGLEQMNERFEVRGSRIYVASTANRAALIAQLQQNDKLPDSTSLTFEALVRENNPWLSQEENNRRWTVALANKIEEVLRMFSGVRHAEVFLDLNDRGRRFLRGGPEPTASVTLFMKGAEPVPRALALAAARLVCGAVRGVKLRNVSVVDGGSGKSALEWEEEDAGGGATLQKQRREHERVIAEKIRGQLGDPNVRVSVQVELDMTATTVQSSTPSEGVALREQRDESQRVRGEPAGQPGVEPNVAAAAGAAAGASSETRTTSTTEFRVGDTVENKQTPSGAIKQVYAAINISYSYLERVFRRRNAPDAQPTDEQINALFEEERKRIVSQVTKLVKPQTEEQVAVDWYYDALAAELPAGTADEDSSVAGTLTLLRRYGPQSALGLLALVAFGLMLSMSRRADATEALGLEIGLPAEQIEAARRAARDAAAAAARARASAPAADVVGVTAPASVGPTAGADGILEGREVDESTVQMQAMLDQIGRFVEKDSEAVAGLLEQWVTRDT